MSDNKMKFFELLTSGNFPFHFDEDDVDALVVFANRHGAPTFGQILLLVEQRAHVRTIMKRILGAGMVVEFHHSPASVVKPVANTIEAVMGIVGKKPQQTVQVWKHTTDGARIDCGYFRMTHNTIALRLIDHVTGDIISLIDAPIVPPTSNRIN